MNRKKVVVTITNTGVFGNVLFSCVFLTKKISNYQKMKFAIERTNLYCHFDVKWTVSGMTLQDYLNNIKSYVCYTFKVLLKIGGPIFCK